MKQHTSKPAGQRRIQKEIKNYLKTNENGNRTQQILQNVARAVLRKKFTAIEAYIEKLVLK